MLGQACLSHTDPGKDILWWFIYSCFPTEKTIFPESIWLAKYIVSRITVYSGCDNTCYKLSFVIITVSTDCLLLAHLLKEGKEKNSILSCFNPKEAGWCHQAITRVWLLFYWEQFLDSLKPTNVWVRKNPCRIIKQQNNWKPISLQGMWRGGIYLQMHKFQN